MKSVNQRKEPRNSQTDQETAEPRPSEVVKQVKAEVQREPNLQHAVEKVREQVVTNPKIDREVAQKVEQVLKEATQLQKVGQESEARDRIQQALAKAEVELNRIGTRNKSKLANQLNRYKLHNQNAVNSRTTPKRSRQRSKSRSSKRAEPTTAVEKVREQVVANPKMDREVAKVEQVLKEATNFNK